MRTHRLNARPGPVTEPGPTGLTKLGLAEGRDGRLYVPATYTPRAPAPLILTSTAPAATPSARSAT